MFFLFCFQNCQHIASLLEIDIHLHTEHWIISPPPPTTPSPTQLRLWCYVNYIAIALQPFKKLCWWRSGGRSVNGQFFIVGLLGSSSSLGYNALWDKSVRAIFQSNVNTVLWSRHTPAATRPGRVNYRWRFVLQVSISIICSKVSSHLRILQAKRFDRRIIDVTSGINKRHSISDW